MNNKDNPTNSTSRKWTKYSIGIFLFRIPHSAFRI
jgi:hypothetical protein